MTTEEIARALCYSSGLYPDSLMAYSHGSDATLNYIPKRIIKNNNVMVVFWNDDTKTIVKRASDETDSDYAAFTAAIGIRMFGSNSALKRIVARTEHQKPKKQKEKKPLVDLSWDGYPAQRVGE